LSWAIPIIAVAFLSLFFLEIRSVQKRRRKQRLIDSWPTFEELYISALESGVSLPEAFRFAEEFGLGELKVHIEQIVSNLDRGVQFHKAIKNFGSKIQLGFADLFVEIVDLAHRTGSQNLVPALQEHAMEVRRELSANGEVLAKTNAILAIAKLGLLAPWVLLAVLSFNERNRDGYNTDAGGLLLTGGFAISLIAFRLVVQAGTIKPLPRVFGVANAS